MNVRRLICSLSLACFSSFLFACSSGGERKPSGASPALPQPDIASVVRTSAFGLTVDRANESLRSRPTLEPTAAPIVLSGGTEEFRLHAFVKPLPLRPELLWLDVYVENLTDSALKDVRLEVKEVNVPLSDLTNDPFAEPTDQRSFLVGGIGPEGIGRLAFGIPRGSDAATLRFEVHGATTRFVTTASAPLALTPDDKEVWTSFADGDTVAVVDAEAGKRVAQISVPGHPASVAITPDGSRVLVASSHANTLTVIDRFGRSIVQTFGEKDGIGHEPRNVVISPDGRRAFVAAYVDDTITAFVWNGTGFAPERTVRVGRRPAGMAVSQDGSVLFVSNFLPRGTLEKNVGWITTLDTSTLNVLREVELHDSLNRDKAHCLAQIFNVPPEKMESEGAPSQLAGVFPNPGGSFAWMPGTRIAGAPVLERGPNSQLDDASLGSITPGETTPSFYHAFDIRNPRETATFKSPGQLDRPVDVRYPRCVKFDLALESPGSEPVPGTEDEYVNRFPAYPTFGNGLSESGVSRFVTFTRGGRRTLFLSYLSDEIVVTDSATLHPSARLAFQLSGSNPTGMVLTKDGSRAFVSYDNSPFVSILDLSAYARPGALPGFVHIPYSYRAVPELPQQAAGGVSPKLMVRNLRGIPERPDVREIGTVPVVDADPMDPVLRRGRILFSSSNVDKYPFLTRSRLGSCAGCHPNGGPDGSVWSTMEGERRTMSLYGGVAGRGWLHISATHSDAHEFVDIIVRERLGGNLSPDDSHALAEFLARGIPRLQGRTVDPGLAARGRTVFETTCVSCHQGEKFTSGTPDPANVWGGADPSSTPRVYDVGTATDSAGALFGKFFEEAAPKKDGELIGRLRGDRDLGDNDPVQKFLDFRPRPNRKRGFFKAPPLVNVWEHSVFMHDGRFDNMKDAVRYLNDRLGLGLNDDDVTAVVAYMETL